MTELDLMSRAEMVRSPMAVAPASIPSRSNVSTDDALKLVLDPYATLVELPIPEHLRVLIEKADRAASQASNDR